ncbi:hypothetical protein [Aureibacter tunicatorum]|uniref:Uncharacterized protein n=1 Tax=Aureibacter tunicatorum TaxID=866807 RepID=A0AAE3XLW9_9BACT|nr:hypothetical protein [Aureibacter tunicatorum]MDR6238880.1 hypothetical protein [Aureibacter tunicatorum]BDD05193.1 hypothetical protein AUTU_26760 [Aureibacter tunicatorum]
MKTAHNLFLFAFATLIFSCVPEDAHLGNTTDKFDSLTYEESIEKWEILKAENSDGYSYKIEFQSFAGFGNVTEIIVESGEVVERNYQEYTRDLNTNEKNIVEEYNEKGASVGSHEKGFSPLTIDELYETCLQDYLEVDSEANQITFETNDLGIISTCGYFPYNCADDCFIGFSMSSFEWID